MLFATMFNTPLLKLDWSLTGGGRSVSLIMSDIHPCTAGDCLDDSDDVNFMLLGCDPRSPLVTMFQHNLLTSLESH